ncbi:MAG TPA: TetR/AcrR family transcriptional regulator [Ilumatobacteraceae bacterium]|nr:TetR/AcrR family transcriptional regulator [Ilumatobacteraceae bacterium]
MLTLVEPQRSVQRRLPSQERSRRRLEHVLDSAAMLVDRVGPDGITTGMIAKAAGVSIGWLYDFFPNRESIFDAVVSRSLDKVTPIAEAVHDARPDDDWRRVLRAVVEALFDFYQSEPGFRVMWFSRFQSTTMLEVNREHDLAGATGAYERLTRHGLQLAGVSPERALHLVIGIIDKGLDLAFRINPLGDRAIVDETVTASIAYLERYAAK